MLYLEIVTPEAVIFQSDVNSVSVPGVDGSFQMLDQHAPIVSLLDKGTIKIKGNKTPVSKDYTEKFHQAKDELQLEINGGTIELSNNKIIILAE